MRVGCGKLALSAAFLLTSAAQSEVLTLRAQSLALSPDGRYLAYGKAQTPQSGPEELWVADLQSGESFKIAAVDPSQFPPQIEAIRPIWSPDGAQLAYFFLHGDGLRLHIWSASRRQPLCSSSEVNSAEEMSRLWPAQWTADSREVLFAAGKLETAWGIHTLYRELRGMAPAENGVTVLKSPTRDRHGRPSMAHTRVVAIDVATCASRTLASGATFVGVRVSQNGKAAIAIAAEPIRISDRSSHYSVYELSLKSGARSPRRLAARIPQGYGMAFGLAPSGRYFAYTTSGPDGSGDVFEVDLRSAAVRNLTAALTLPRNPLDRLTSTGLRDLDWHGKFGASFIAPIWTADEKALIVPRLTSREQGQVPVHVDLWRIPRDGRPARRLAVDPGLSIVEWARCGDLSEPCLAGRARELMARVRLERQQPQSDVAALAAIDPECGKTRILRTIGAAGAPPIPFEADINVQLGRLAVAREGDIVVGLEETQDRPPELWGVALHSRIPPRPLDLLNPGPPPPAGRYVRLAWTSAEGERLGAALRLPAAGNANARPPLVITVYSGGAVSLAGDGEFDGGKNTWDPLRRQGGFATLAVDLQSAQPPGTYCERATRNVEAALDEAIATGLIDGRRVGIAGTSFGGFTVNCVVTRSSRLRAAVSVAGISNWTLEIKPAALGGLTQYLGWSGGPWQYPEAYVSDSPIFHLQHVKTPLLVVYGKQDTLGEHSIAMFDGLSALGKPAELVGYDAAGHSEMFAYPDFWSRVIEWFNEWFQRSETSPEKAQFGYD